MEFGRLKVRLRVLGSTAQLNDQWRTGEALFTLGHLTFRAMSLDVVNIDEVPRRPATRSEQAGLETRCSVVTLGTAQGRVELVVPDRWVDWAVRELRSES
jgi:hypothetical protein